LCREDGKPDGQGPQSTVDFSSEDLIKESLPVGRQANPAANYKPTDTNLTPQQLKEVGAL
jgi:hypothetical protein